MEDRSLAGRGLRLGFPGAQGPGRNVLWGLGDHAGRPGPRSGIGVAADTSAETRAVCCSPPAPAAVAGGAAGAGTPGLCSSVRPERHSRPAERGCCPLVVRARRPGSCRSREQSSIQGPLHRHLQWAFSPHDTLKPRKAGPVAPGLHTELKPQGVGPDLSPSLCASRPPLGPRGRPLLSLWAGTLSTRQRRTQGTVSDRPLRPEQAARVPGRRRGPAS